MRIMRFLSRWSKAVFALVIFGACRESAFAQCEILQAVYHIREASASKFGHEEFVPSIPPKYYLLKRAAITNYAHEFADETVGPNTFSETTEASCGITLMLKYNLTEILKEPGYGYETEYSGQSFLAGTNDCVWGPDNPKDLPTHLWSIKRGSYDPSRGWISTGEGQDGPFTVSDAVGAEVDYIVGLFLKSGVNFDFNWTYVDWHPNNPGNLINRTPLLQECGQSISGYSNQSVNGFPGSDQWRAEWKNVQTLESEFTDIMLVPFLRKALDNTGYPEFSIVNHADSTWGTLFGAAESHMDIANATLFGKDMEYTFRVSNTLPYTSYHIEWDLVTTNTAGAELSIQSLDAWTNDDGGDPSSYVQTREQYVAAPPEPSGAYVRNWRITGHTP